VWRRGHSKAGKNRSCGACEACWNSEQQDNQDGQFQQELSGLARGQLEDELSEEKSEGDTQDGA